MSDPTPTDEEVRQAHLVLAKRGCKSFVISRAVYFHLSPEIWLAYWKAGAKPDLGDVTEEHRTSDLCNLAVTCPYFHGWNEIPTECLTKTLSLALASDVCHLHGRPCSDHESRGWYFWEGMAWRTDWYFDDDVLEAWIGHSQALRGAYWLDQIRDDAYSPVVAAACERALQKLQRTDVRPHRLHASQLALYRKAYLAPVIAAVTLLPTVLADIVASYW